MKVMEEKKMNKKLFCAILASTVIAAGTVCYAAANYTTSQNPYTSANKTMQPLKGNVVMIPSGVCIPAVTNMVLSSEFLTLGQGVSVPIMNNYYYNNTLVAPSGSSINGTVIQVKKAGRAGINGQLMIKFTNILTPYGQMIPISGMIKTDDGTGLLKGGTKMDSAKEYGKDIAIGTAAGAIAGTIMGPLSGGKVGKGAVYGTAVGAGAGLAKSLWDKGEEAEIPAGSQIEIVIDQPITFSPQ